jgi:malyl-CoA/(S)-citramalyl-CoA lyase
MCIRPNQVEPLNRGFTPEALEVDTAQRLVDAFSHQRESEANIVHVDGKIAELSSLKQAESLVANAKACSSRDEEKTTAVALASEDA